MILCDENSIWVIAVTAYLMIISIYAFLRLMLPIVKHLALSSWIDVYGRFRVFLFYVIPEELQILKRYFDLL